MSVTACHLHHERVSLEENLELGTNQEKKGKKKKPEKTFTSCDPYLLSCFVRSLDLRRGCVPYLQATPKESKSVSFRSAGPLT